MKYGSIPAGGLGTRLQPLGFSKELAPVGRRAVIEYLIERMTSAGIDKIFVSTAEDKTDLIRYLAGKSIYQDNLIFLVRERKGLLDGVTLPEQFLHDDDELYFGLPDTIWYPKNGFRQLAEVDEELVLGLFETGTPERFDSVTTDHRGRITKIEVKVPAPQSPWTWGIGKMSVRTARILRELEQKGKEKTFGEVMQRYSIKYPAYALELSRSHYLDIGIPEDYAKAEFFLHEHEK